MQDCGEYLPLALDPIEPAALDFILQVERHYASLIAAGDAVLGTDSGPGLGGKLLYAGELDAAGRALLVAGNIAGVASLAATADEAGQKQAIREGVADFLVTSLSEALRILKNQIRKRETVAVCIGMASEIIEREMVERGVLPDLLRPADTRSQYSSFVSGSARQISPPTMAGNSIQLIWRVASAPAIWLPKLDAIAIECLQPDALSARRWLRLAPRYLGRMSQSVRFLFCNQKFKASFIEEVRGQIERGEIRIPVEIQSTDQDGGQDTFDLQWLSPPGHSESKN
jgi:urocanate hydratase